MGSFLGREIETRLTREREEEGDADRLWQKVEPALIPCEFSERWKTDVYY